VYARCLSRPQALPCRPELVFISKRKGQEVRIHQSDRPDDEICILSDAARAAWRSRRGENREQSRHSSASERVRRAADRESITPQMRETLDDELTEVKSENAMRSHHVASESANPREGAGWRAFSYPHGARCALRGGRGVARPLLQGLRLLEDDALGGGGSRGSGRVSFSGLKLTWRGKDYYAAGAAEREIASGRRRRGAAGESTGDRRGFGCLTVSRLTEMSLTEVRLRPAGPWRTGHPRAIGTVDVIYHSDAL